MKLKPTLLTGSTFRLMLRTAILPSVLGMAFHSAPVRAQSLEDLIGGDEVIPLNPNFNPEIDLEFEDGGNNELLNDTEFLENVFLGGASVANFSSPNATLGAALSSSLSASNRPSVLTPFVGILTFDPNSNEAVYDTFGALSANKATTLGRGKLGLGVSYQHAKFDEFDGKDIGKVFLDQESADKVTSRDVDSEIIPGVVFRQRGEISQFKRITASDVEFTADVVTLSISYGLLDNLDVGALIPYIWLNTKGRITADIGQEGNVTFNLVDTKGTDDLGDDETIEGVSTEGRFSGRKRTTEKFDRDFEGIGDIILFGKLQVVSEQGLPNRLKGPLDVALQVEIKLPTGDEDEFLGTGETDVALRVIFQKQVLERLILRGEVGYNYSGLGSNFSSVDLKAGAEFQVTPKLTSSLEVISNISDEFDEVIDAIAGAKYAISRDFKVFAGVRFPLNDNGLRFRYSPIVGAEYTFSPRSGSIEGEEAQSATEIEEQTAVEEPVASDSTQSPAATDSAAPAPAATGDLTLQPTDSQNFGSEAKKSEDETKDSQPETSGAVQPLPLPSGPK